MSDTIFGRHSRRDDPYWDPLEAILPLRLCGSFMWMGQVELTDGTLVQLYKHRATRRYLHLDDHGRSYAYGHRDRYREIGRAEALGECFGRWEELLPGPDDGDRAALAEVMAACAEAA